MAYVWVSSYLVELGQEKDRGGGDSGDEDLIGNRIRCNSLLHEERRHRDAEEVEEDVLGSDAGEPRVHDHLLQDLLELFLGQRFPLPLMVSLHFWWREPNIILLSGTLINKMDIYNLFHDNTKENYYMIW